MSDNPLDDIFTEARHSLVLDQMHPLAAHARGPDRALHHPLLLPAQRQRALIYER